MIAGVKYSDYEDLVQGTTVEELTEPYVWTLFPLILTMLRAIPADERVELIFEDQPVYRERALKVLSLIVKEDEDRPEFLTSKGLPKLAKWSFCQRIALRSWTHLIICCHLSGITISTKPPRRPNGRVQSWFQPIG